MGTEATTENAVQRSFDALSALTTKRFVTVAVNTVNDETTSLSAPVLRLVLLEAIRRLAEVPANVWDAIPPAGADV